MKVSQRKLSTIKPYPENPRKITDEAVSAVARSLEDFGWRQPIVVDKKGVIIVGHTRYLAALSLELETVPVHVMDVTEEQARGYRLADNRLGEKAEWDVQLLSGELRWLDEKLDMTPLGFSAAELEMARIDDLSVMTGRAAEPWGGDPTALVHEKQDFPRCIVYFQTPEAKETFFEWLATQDSNYRKQTSKNETYVAYLPKREQMAFNVEDGPEGEEAEPAWHWVVDDNIPAFYRLTIDNMTHVRNGPKFFAEMERYITQFRNVGMGGPQNHGFVALRHSDIRRAIPNTRIYSCNLIRTSLPYRWRGRYNEDTILSLDCLSNRWATLLLYEWLMDKEESRKIPGGNTDQLYRTGTGPKSRLLGRVYPKYVDMRYRFGRIHHYIDYRKHFGDIPLLLEGRPQ